MKFRIICFICPIWVLCAQVKDSSVYKFGKVGLDAEIRHTFTFRNPQAKSACGCGESFSV